MKELILVRHAKSDWSNPGLQDVDRHLNERGYTDAYALSAWYCENKKKPASIISSTATRAVSTALIFLRALDLPLSQFSLCDTIYESTLEPVLDLIKKQNDSLKSVMLFGHNPTFADTINYLLATHSFDNLPTCGIVSLHFNAKHWTNLQPKTAELNYYHFPKDTKFNL